MKPPLFACPACHKDFSVEITSPDQSVQCPHCRQTVHVPSTPAAKWYVAQGNQKIGPLTLNQLQAMINKGELQRDTMLLKDGDGVWTRAGEFPLLFPKPTATFSAPRYGKRFMAIVSCLVVFLIVGGGWYVLSNRPFDSNKKKQIVAKKVKPSPKNKKDGIDKKKPPEKIDIKKLPPNERKVLPLVLQKINAMRGSAGLPKVHYDPKLKEFCEWYAKRLDHDPKMLEQHLKGQAPPPGSVSKLVKARKTLLVFAGKPIAKINDSMKAATQRLRLLDPRLENIGIGLAKSAKYGDIVVVDPTSGRDETIVIYPVNGQTNVPLGVNTRNPLAPKYVRPKVQRPQPPRIIVWSPEMGLKELMRELSKPDARLHIVLQKLPSKSFPITVRFPSHSNLKQFEANLIGASGNSFAVHGKIQGNSVVSYRFGPFKPATEYRFRMRGIVSGKKWQKEVSFTTGPTAKLKTSLTKNALHKINAYRKQANLEPVVLDDKISIGCRQHARYLVLNADQPFVLGRGAYTEFLGLGWNVPGYSDLGKRAAERSNVLIGDIDPVRCIDTWMASCIHRSGLLDPMLERVGFGFARDHDVGWVTVLDVMSGRNPNRKVVDLHYPIKNQIDVPVAFAPLGDIFDPIPDDKNKRAGFPISLLTRENIRKGKLIDTMRNEKVECWYWSLNDFADVRAKQYRLTCLIPYEPLRPAAKYRVEFEKPNGKTFAWHFTTAVPARPENAVSATLARINHYRKLANLPPAETVHKWLCKCQAHADYLLKRIEANDMATQDIDTEFGHKDGFSVSGKQAAERSLIALKLATPELHIDRLMAHAKFRSLILDPQLKYVDIGCAHDPVNGWISVLDFKLYAHYPGVKQADIEIIGHDRPKRWAADRCGFPITFSYFQPVDHIEANLKKAAGSEVDFHADSFNSANPNSSHPNTVRVIPTSPLEPNTEYRVTVTLRIGPEDLHYSWTFTTKK